MVVVFVDGDDGTITAYKDVESMKKDQWFGWYYEIPEATVSQITFTLADLLGTQSYEIFEQWARKHEMKRTDFDKGDLTKEEE